MTPTPSPLPFVIIDDFIWMSPELERALLDYRKKLRQAGEL